MNIILRNTVYFACASAEGSPYVCYEHSACMNTSCSIHDTNLCISALCAHFRLAVLRRWRSKYGLAATYRNLAKCFYSAGKPEIVEVVCQALGSPYVIKGAVPPSESVYNMELYAILTDYSVI